MTDTLEKVFITFCNNRNLEINKNQIQVIKKLQYYYDYNFRSLISKIFYKNKNQKSFYLFGDVGVGKTMILNFFFDQIKEKKIRLHFNQFMINFHEFVHQQKDKKEENIISLFVKGLKNKATLICFDEFQVTNIVDAMILGKLFDQIFKEDIKIIVTSNTKISELYKDGLQRDQFKPFIKIMEKKSIEQELIIDDDYRKSKKNLTERFFYPLNQETNFKINKYFRTISKGKKLTKKILNINGRDFVINNFYEGIVRFDFSELCEQNLGSKDYIEIVKNCGFIVLDNIPQFDDINSNQQQRFITLLDIIYEKKIPIAVTSKLNLSSFSSSRLLEKPFKRTISRLYELTSMTYN
jgi:cell division protein ZapE|tara:strand:- start:1221 stop:2276 length:1056 start_codon:yes stop_codon:yes gene_type:complete